MGISNRFIHSLHSPVVGEYASLNMGTSVCKMEQSGVEIMGIVLMVAGLIGLALLAYLFYVLFRGEEL